MLTFIGINLAKTDPNGDFAYILKPRFGGGINEIFQELNFPQSRTTEISGNN
jgi:hypothetical protein